MTTWQTSLKTAIIMVPLAAALGGCFGGDSGRSSSREAPPEWYLDPPDRGPNTMVSVGSGPNRRAAYDRAAAELSRQLRLDIQVDDQTVRDYIGTTNASSSGDTTRSERMVEQALETVQTQSAQEGLPGVTEDEYHRGERQDYVMVTFDRSSWANDLIARLGEIDQQLSTARARARSNRPRPCSHWSWPRAAADSRRTQTAR